MDGSESWRPSIYFVPARLSLELEASVNKGFPVYPETSCHMREKLDPLLLRLLPIILDPYCKFLNVKLT